MPWLPRPWFASGTPLRLFLSFINPPPSRMVRLVHLATDIFGGPDEKVSSQQRPEPSEVVCSVLEGRAFGLCILAGCLETHLGLLDAGFPATLVLFGPHRLGLTRVRSVIAGPGQGETFFFHSGIHSGLNSGISRSTFAGAVWNACRGRLLARWWAV